jgi:hypothetical protein
VNQAYENDLGQTDIQHRFSSPNAVPTIAAQTEKGSLVCILNVKVKKNNDKSIVMNSSVTLISNNHH